MMQPRFIDPILRVRGTVLGYPVYFVAAHDFWCFTVALTGDPEMIEPDYPQQGMFVDGDHTGYYLTDELSAGTVVGFLAVVDDCKRRFVRDVLEGACARSC